MRTDHAGKPEYERDEEGGSPLADILAVVQIAELGRLLGQARLVKQVSCRNRQVITLLPDTPKPTAFKHTILQLRVPTIYVY